MALEGPDNTRVLQLYTRSKHCCQLLSAMSVRPRVESECAPSCYIPYMVLDFVIKETALVTVPPIHHTLAVQS